MIALIPARAGSKRCPGKNTRLLHGHPLIAYTIAAAKASEVFDRLYVCTDDVYSVTTAMPASSLLQSVEFMVAGPPCHTDTCCDITWVRKALQCMDRPDTFAILRPTSPFRTAATIQRAYKVFQAMADCGDSIRAVEPVRQTPYKMWTWGGPGDPIKPLLDGKNAEGVPWHSCPTQTCPPVYIQNSSLEMAWTANVEVHGTIHGRKVGPFFTEGYEGFAIDTEEDWHKAEALAQDHPEALPTVASSSGPDVVVRRLRTGDL